MARLDENLVRRWFATITDRAVPLMPHWGIVPSEAELGVLDEGRELLVAAITRSALPVPPPVPAPEQAARQVQTYLHALAAGVGGTQAALREQLALEGGGPVLTAVATDPLPTDVLDAAPAVPSIALVAGLIAGAAALQDSLSRPSPPETPNFEPTAAESARLAGVSAAELVVDGADLHTIAAQAASTAAQGWSVGMPAGPPQARVEYRTRGLIGMLLIALRQAAREPDGPVEPASCGARPAENPGRPFAAEVTFEVHCEAPDAAALQTELAALAEVVVASAAGVHSFHVHTDRPGEVVSLAYATATLFDLVIAAATDPHE